jgi:hypothetical protein
VERARTFVLVDERDAVERQAEIMSLSVTNPWYGVYRLGDAQVVPDRLTILANGLQERLGRELEGERVVVHRFTIFNNVQSGLRGTAMTAGTDGATGTLGVVSGDIAGGVAGSIVAANESTAPYLLEKNPSNSASVIVDVDVDVGGRRVVDKIVQLEPAGYDDEFVAERIRRAIHAAVHLIAGMPGG